MIAKTLPRGSKFGVFGSRIGSLATRQSLFGSPGRTDVLVLVTALDRSYPRELARLTRLPMTSVLRILDDFERSGPLVSTRIAGVREVRLNPDWVAAKELRTLLEALAERESRYSKIISEASRRRPRRRGKKF